MFLQFLKKYGHFSTFPVGAEVPKKLILRTRAKKASSLERSLQFIIPVYKIFILRTKNGAYTVNFKA